MAEAHPVNVFMVKFLQGKRKCRKRRAKISAVHQLLIFSESRDSLKYTNARKLNC